MSLPIVNIPSKVTFTNDDGAIDEYICNEKLGQGGFATVYRVTNKINNKSYAMKIISRELFLNSKNISLFHKIENEIQIQKTLDHPNIISLKASFTDDINQYMILEYCPGKTIREYIRKREKGYLSEPETRKILNDLLHGLVYLHNHKIIHHDLKLENLIIGTDGNVKIADFGVSRVLKSYNDKCFSINGTINYMSPELFQNENKGHSFEVDIWAIGVSAFMMLTGQYPFNGVSKKDIQDKIKNCEYCFPTNLQLSDDAKNFIKSIFRIDPRKRPTANKLLEHPFLTKIDKEKVKLYESNKPIQKKLFSYTSSQSLNNRYNCFYLGNTNSKPIVKPIVSNDLAQSLKKFNFNNVVNHSKEYSQMNEFGFTIPSHFVVKYSFYYDDLCFLMQDGSVGICFNDRSRIVMDPNEEFIQYYKNYNSTGEVINLDDVLNEQQKYKLQNKISLVQKFAANFKKFQSLYNLTDKIYDQRIPLDHVKYFVKKNDLILFKLFDKNVQVNFNDQKKLIIFSSSKKICLVKRLKEQCNLIDINVVMKMNDNCEEYKKYKIAEDLLSFVP